MTRISVTKSTTKMPPKPRKARVANPIGKAAAKLSNMMKTKKTNVEEVDVNDANLPGNIGHDDEVLFDSALDLADQPPVKIEAPRINDTNNLQELIMKTIKEQFESLKEQRAHEKAARAKELLAYKLERKKELANERLARNEELRNILLGKEKAISDQLHKKHVAEVQQIRKQQFNY